MLQNGILPTTKNVNSFFLPFAKFKKMEKLNDNFKD